MLESLAAMILQKSLGWLVDGLDSKNFDVSLWSGEVILHNLAVKGDALDGLGLPIKVRRGQLRSLRLKIPWRSLSTQQVVIQISGLDILAIPQNEFPKEDQEAQKIAAIEKKKATIVTREKIRQEKKEGTKKGVEAGAPPGRIAALITSIVDNCRVEISDIHVRIEDHSSSDVPFAFGIKLQSIGLESVNKLFEISREEDVATKTKDFGIIRKALEMNGLAVYLDPLYTKDGRKRKDILQRPINEQNQPGETSNTIIPQQAQHVHIVPPISLQLKVTFDDTLVGGNGPKINDTTTTPVLGVALKLPSIGLTISKQQYCSIINLTSFIR